VREQRPQRLAAALAGFGLHAHPDAESLRTFEVRVGVAEVPQRQGDVGHPDQDDLAAEQGEALRQRSPRAKVCITSRGVAP
jgi:hypothetical protein